MAERVVEYGSSDHLHEESVIPTPIDQIEKGLSPEQYSALQNLKAMASEGLPELMTEEYMPMIRTLPPMVVLKYQSQACKAASDQWERLDEALRPEKGPMFPTATRVLKDPLEGANENNRIVFQKHYLDMQKEFIDQAIGIMQSTGISSKE